MAPDEQALDANGWMLWVEAHGGRRGEEPGQYGAGFEAGEPRVATPSRKIAS